MVDRLLDTVYQNTGNRLRIVTMVILSEIDANLSDTLVGTSGVEVYCDADNPPVTTVAHDFISINLIGLDSGANQDLDRCHTLMFAVPVGYYYQAESKSSGHGAAPVLESWVEYDIF